MLQALCILPLLILSTACASTGRSTPYAGALAGISTLSADARAIVRSASADVSLYKPENGAALNLLAGVHIGDFFSVQGNYVWNRNSLTIASIRAAEGAFVEERRESAQHGVVADGLLYFRNLDSWVRPYLSGGVGLVRFEGHAPALLASRGDLPRPAPTFVSTNPALRVAVGIDLRATAAWRFRYSFSETIGRNPVSERLSPPAERNLANFQNLFGVIASF